MKRAGQDFAQVAENGTPFENEDYALATPTQTAVIAMDDNKDFVADLTSRETTFCSMVANTPAEKALLFKAMNNPEKTCRRLYQHDDSGKRPLLRGRYMHQSADRTE